MQWITALFDSRIFMKADAVLGFFCLGLFLYFYFTKEGKDERGRSLLATAALIGFVVLFLVFNAFSYCLVFFMDNLIRMANGLQLVYTLFLMSVDLAYLILRKLK